MHVITVFRWTIDIDLERTRAVYEKRLRGAPEECGCVHCRNFVAAREHVYTPEVLALLSRFGLMPPMREAEIYHNAPLESGLHSYGGWFHFVGQLIDGEDAWQPSGPNSDLFVPEKFNTRFQIGISRDISLVPAEAFGISTLVQLDFAAEVPWLLEEPWE